MSYIGYDGTGVFTQTGGTNTISYDLNLGVNSGSTGTYFLNGGTLNVDDIVSGAGTSSLLIDGGTLILGGGTSGTIDVDFFYVGGAFGSNGDFTLNSGQTLYTTRELIGNMGTGVFTQTGGLNTTNFISSAITPAPAARIT